jgi:dolichol-phosphate mannosyltransferase
MGDPTSIESLLPVPTGPLRLAADAAIELSVIIPTFNETENIGALVEQLTTILDAEIGEGYELIIVDDNSPDQTWKTALNLTATYPHLRVMQRKFERGLSTAVIRGWQAARGRVLAVIDADLQHPPEVIAKLWREMGRGADLVVASRHVEGGGVSDWRLSRRILSRGAQVLGVILMPGVVGRVSDPMSGYFMVRRGAIAGSVMKPVGYKILIEVLARGRMIRWISEVGYVFRERVEGKSKVTAGVYVDYLVHLIHLRLEFLRSSRFVRFCLVGLSGAIVDMSALFALSDPAMLGWGLTRSKLIAAELAIINNFLWNDAWTFGDLAARQQTFRQKLRRLAKFNVVCGIGLVLNVVLLNLQFNLLGMNRYVANAIAIGIVTGWNYILNLRLAWRTTGGDPAEPSQD